jgi:NADH:ubiquinone oxidoreductase subunit 6 (subunit J)
MTTVTLLFYFFAILTALGAGAILFSKNIFKSALYLLVSLLSIAALYALSYAEFLAVTQILIYAGGILVIIIFGIMLTTKISGKPLVVKNAHVFSGAISGFTLFILLMNNLPLLFQAEQEGLKPENINVIGLSIFSTYSLPFEIAGILLLVALIGAAVITSQLKTEV